MIISITTLKKSLLQILVLTGLFIIFSSTALAAPTVSSFVSDNDGRGGSMLEIYGTGFDLIGTVAFVGENKGKTGKEYRVTAFKGDENFIRVEVPKNISAGEYTVLLLSVKEDIPATKVGKFVVEGEKPVKAPTVSSFVSDNDGRGGSMLEIYGTGFDLIGTVAFVGENKGKTGKEYRVTAFKGDENFIRVEVPKNISAGEYTVLLLSVKEDIPATKVGKFVVEGEKPVKAPTVSSFVSDNDGRGGSMLEIYGTGFDLIGTVAFVGENKGKTGKEYRVTAFKGDENFIRVEVPKNISAGEYTVLLLSVKEDIPATKVGKFVVEGEKPVKEQGKEEIDNFLLNLRMGMESQDVKRLQILLNRDPETQLIGEGSTGQENAYFGLSTKVAVQKFQCKYNIVCTGSADKNGYGAVGPKTRIKLNELQQNNPKIEPENSSTEKDKDRAALIASLLEQINILREKLKQLQ